MAFVELDKVHSPEGMEKYLSQERSSPSVEANPEGMTAQMAKEIEAEHARFPRKNLKVLSRTITQSWSPQESGLHSPEKYNEMGKELAAKWAPGHLAWVTTHTDKNHIHNHIVICSVNSNTGKILQTRKGDLKRLHQVSNEICRENGLSEMKKRVKEPDVNMPKKVRQLVERGRNSWYADLVQKVDFARAATTGFDEYVGVLHELGVNARVENKNISYIYRDKKPIRGKTLGENFDKEGLMKAFKENDAKFAKVPGLKGQLRGDIRSAFDRQGNRLGTPSDLLLESASYQGGRKKDYGQFTKLDRRQPSVDLPAIFDERGGVLYSEMKKARGLSVIDYCREHKIQTQVNKDGKTVLKGRSFIVIDGATWTNTKNDQQGGLLQFVAIHDETTYVRALSKINKNPRLLLLEQAMGEYKRGYQSFYIPKPKKADDPAAKASLSRLLKSESLPPKAENALLKIGRVHVGNNGSVWLTNEKEDAALEFREEPGGGWRGKRHGNPASVFHESVSKSKKLLVFRDPFEFAIFKAQTSQNSSMNENLIVFFSAKDSDRRLNEFLAVHTHVKEVHLLQFGRSDQGGQTFNEVKGRLDPFRIEVKPIQLGNLGKDRGRGPDIEF